MLKRVGDQLVVYQLCAAQHHKVVTKFVGNVVGTTASDLFLRIRTGDTNMDVSDSATSAGKARFDFKLDRLTEAGTWYDILVGTKSTGNLRDVKSTVADMGSTTAGGNRLYSFQEWAGDLKVTFAADPGIEVVSATMLDVDGTPTLRVTGTSGLPKSDSFLRVRSGSWSADVPNTAITAGALQFDVDMSKLTIKDNRYDLLVGSKSLNALKDIKDSVADMNQSLTAGDREYTFHQWGGDLKVAFENKTPAVVTVTPGAAEFFLDGDIPKLRVVGTVAGAEATAVHLYLDNTEGTVLNAAALAGETPGSFVVSFTLSEINSTGKWWNWFRMKVGKTEASTVRVTETAGPSYINIPAGQPDSHGQYDFVNDGDGYSVRLRDQ